MVIETYPRGPTPVYERFAQHGRMLPPGVLYVDSWIDERLDRCFQVMETDDRAALDAWMTAWSDLVEFEVIPVLSSEEAERKVRASE
jgi:Protein of unknown function (DUF3303)